MSLVAWGVHEANISSASVGDWPGATRLPVLILGLSLDPKQKVVRSKTKTYFTKKVRCHSIPTLLIRLARTSILIICERLRAMPLTSLS